MQRILDLIETTLDADVTPQELAEASGYSPWHFLHLFRDVMGMPLCRYRNRRRLAHAIWHVSRGMGVTDAALRWGFGTHSGFYRAFRREYGCSPAEFIRSHRVRRPSPPRIVEEVFRMMTRERCSEALRHWGLELPLTPVTYPHSGEVCDHAMYAGEDYVLKACRDAQTCRMTAGVAEALLACGVPAARAIPLPEGGLSLPMADLHVMLQRRLKGEMLRTPQLLASPEESGRRIGQALAGLHQALASMKETPLVDEMDMAGHLLDWAWPRAKEVLPQGFPADFAQRAEALRALPGCIIHRDANPSNLVDTAEGIGFVDFDLSVRACRIFDPCYMATAVLSESYGRDELPWRTAWPVFARALLQGYDERCPLSSAEWQAASTLMLGNELLALAAFADSSRYREVFETNRQMLGWMLENMPV